MFTGIVEEIGEIVEAHASGDGSRLRVRAPLVSADAGHGDSIAVNGVCLTVVHTDGASFAVDVVAETLSRSSLAGAGVGTRVNLERSVALGQRLGGHIVQGHVDGTAVVRGSDPDGLTSFAVAPALARYLVDKGSVTVDGVSLTVVDAGADTFSVALIPTTLADTTLGGLAPGAAVNVEVDVLAKYVHRMAAPYLAGSVGETMVATGEELG